MKNYFYLVLLSLIFSCQSNETSKEQLDRVKISVEEAYNSLCEIYSGTDVDSIVSFYEDNIIRIPPNGEILVGKTLLREQKARTRQLNKYSLDEYGSPEILVSQNQAVTYSTFKDSEISYETGDTVRTAGTWVAVWRKQPDGSWKIALSTFTQKSLGN